LNIHLNLNMNFLAGINAEFFRRFMFKFRCMFKYQR